MSSADGNHQGHRLTVQPARDERQHAQRRLIEPVCVVGDQDHWACVRGVTHELKGGEGDAKWIWVQVSTYAERGIQRLTLAFRQVFGQPDDGMQKLVQPGEREFGLRLNPDRGQDAAATYPATFSGALQECCFADAGFATDGQRAAAALTEPVDELVDELGLGLAPDQFSRCTESRRRAHRPQHRECSLQARLIFPGDTHEQRVTSVAYPAPAGSDVQVPSTRSLPDSPAVWTAPWLTAGYLRSAGIEPLPLEQLLAISQVTFVLASPTSENRGMLSRSALELIPAVRRRSSPATGCCVAISAMTSSSIWQRLRLMSSSALAAHRERVVRRSNE